MVVALQVGCSDITRSQWLGRVRTEVSPLAIDYILIIDSSMHLRLLMLLCIVFVMCSNHFGYSSSQLLLGATSERATRQLIGLRQRQPSKQLRVDS